MIALSQTDRLAALRHQQLGAVAAGWNHSAHAEPGAGPSCSYRYPAVEGASHV
jgi:hypothetical protein